MPAAPKLTKQIACTACRRRKQRCNRQTPCEECIRRGLPHLCQPDYRKAGPSNTALDAQVQVHGSRLQHIESFLASQFPAFSSTLGADEQSPVDQQVAQEDPIEEDEEPQTSITDNQPVLEANVENSLLEQDGFDFGPILASFEDFNLFNGNDTANTLTPPNILYSSVRSTSVYHQSYAWTQHLLLHLLSLLPQPSIVQTMVNFYFAPNAMRSVHGINSIQFNAELAEFERFRSSNQAHEVDPAWLALLYILISAGIMVEYETHGHISGANVPTQIFTLIDTFAHCSHGALAAANWATTPNLRVVQTLAVMAWTSQHTDVKTSTFERDSEQQTHRVAIALQHCRKFGLDQLGSDPECMPAPEPAFGSSHSGFRREMALRLWHDYQMMETLAACYLIDRDKCTSAHPALCQEEDLGWSTVTVERSIRDNPSGLYVIGQRALSAHLSGFYKVRHDPNASLQEYEGLAEFHEKQVDSQIVALQGAPSTFIGPSVLHSREAYHTFCTMNKYGGLLRIWRAGMGHFRRKPADFAACEAKAKQAAINTVGCLTKPVAIAVTRGMPFAVTFLLNASVLLFAALLKEEDHAKIVTYLTLLKSTAEVCQDAIQNSRMRSVVANAERASNVISAFAQKLHGLQSVRSGRLARHIGDIAKLARLQQVSVPLVSSESSSLPPSSTFDIAAQANDWMSFEDFLVASPTNHGLFLADFANTFDFGTFQPFSTASSASM